MNGDKKGEFVIWADNPIRVMTGKKLMQGI